MISAPLTVLICRSLVLRRVMIVLALVVGAVISVVGAVSAVTLTPLQVVERDLGRHDASVQLPVELQLGEEAPSTRGFEQGMGYFGASGFSYELTAIAVETAHDDRGSTLIQARWSGDEHHPRYVLRSGRWPERPGEAVLITPNRDAPMGGSLAIFGVSDALTVVGRADDKYAKQAQKILVAPGTWEMFGGDVRRRYPTSTAILIAYWVQQHQIPIQTAMDSWVGSHGGAPESAASTMALSFATRESLLGVADPLQSRFPLTLILPSLLLPFVTGLLSAAITQRWLRGLVLTLHRQGALRQSVIRSAVLGTTVIFILAILIGAASGTLLVSLLRPVLEQFSSQQLAPWAVPWSGIALTAFGAAGGLVGLISPEPRLSIELSRRWGRRAWLTGTIASAAVLLASALLPPTPITITAIVVSGVLATGSAAPWVLGLLIKAPRSATASRRLGRVLLESDRPRASVTLFSLVLAITLPILSLSVVLSAEEAARRRTVDNLPPGYARLLPAGGMAIPDEVRTRFEAATGLASPVETSVLEDGQRIPEFGGVVWLFSSEGEVERWLGAPLAVRERTTLTDGGLLLTRDFAASVRLTLGEDESVDLDARPLTIAPEWKQQVGGVALRTTFPATAPTSELAFTYVGVSQAQAEQVRNAAQLMGVSADYVEFPRTPDEVRMPARYMLGLWLFSAVPAVILATWSASQSRLLRPSLAGLMALGMPRRWLFDILMRQTGGLALTAMLMATGCSLFIHGIMAMQSNDRVVVFPWEGVLISVFSTWVCVLVGTLNGLIRLTARERHVT